MEIQHRTVIQKYHCELLNNCNFRSLLPNLVKNKVFSENMIKDYEKCDHNSKVRLLFDLLGRGPKAFDNFIISLNETNQIYLSSKLLGKEDKTFPTKNIYNTTLSNSNPLHQRTRHLNVKVAPSLEFKDDFNSLTNPYYMRSKCRGAALIINNKMFDEKPRRGAQVDQDNLQELFRQMGGYYLKIKEDKNSTELMDDIIRFSKNDILKNVDILFTIIMSHGDSDIYDSYVECVDGKYIPASFIEKQFDNENCIHMQGKPKVVIYQICRGLGRGRDVSRTDNDGQKLNPIRNDADMLVCHSTAQGCIAHRDIELGSWYIHTLCEIFMQYAQNHHIEDLFHMVDRSLSTWKSDDSYQTMQTPNFRNFGFRHCFLNPGIYEEDNILIHYDIN